MNLKLSYTAEALAVIHHIELWSGCEKCSLHKTCRTHVLWDASPDWPNNTPHEIAVLFIGEGPGKGEDVLGKPFVGVSGKLLRDTIVRTNSNRFSCGFNNLVACRPTDGISSPNRQSNSYEIASCQPRLVEIIRISQPVAIVACGVVAADYIGQLKYQAKSDAFLVEIEHPAYVLRMGGIQWDGYERYCDKFYSMFEEVREKKLQWQSQQLTNGTCTKTE